MSEQPPRSRQEQHTDKEIVRTKPATPKKKTPEQKKRSGCAQALATIALILWLAIVPAGTTFLSKMVLATPAGLAQAIALGLTAILLLPPFIGVALAARRREGWAAPGATAAALTAVAGALLIDGVLRAFPLNDNWLATLRFFIILPYTMSAAWWAPRLTKTSSRSPWAWLGLGRFDLPNLFLSLTLAAILTAPWVFTGALGDRLTSLEIAAQTAAWAIVQATLFWGLTLILLTTVFENRRIATLVAFLIYVAGIAGGTMPTGEWSALMDIFLLAPLAMIVIELNPPRHGIYPILPLVILYRLVPALFVDPRDALAQGGIPELQHIASNLIVLAAAVLTAFALAIGRRIWRAIRSQVDIPGWAAAAGSALAALVLWAIWSGLYVFAGSPGFYDDGFLIIMEERADLSPAYGIDNREARIEFVYNALVETANRSQADLRAELDEMDVPYRPYYVINMIRVDGHRWLMGRFEGRPGVAAVIPNPNVREYPYRIPIPYTEAESPPPDVQANLTAIGADAAWEIGVTGEGIVVGGQDTGYDWSHPALQPHYRGWDGVDADHDYNWHDAWDDEASPFDDGNHGTHTMGTILGDDGGANRTGVAPGAQWIGCRNMRRGFGNPGAYAECMEFFLAPYPHGGDPFTDGDVRMAPYVINNSWGCPDFEGCFPDTLETGVEALRAAGIMMVVSAGNDGPGCSTVTSPPANYDASFSVGATSNTGTVTSFSSRGPVDGRVKPDVSAPGANVRSSIPGGGYALAGGTSMAGPHVAGLVALIWSADADLVGDIDATEALICQTAEPRPVEAACTAEEEVDDAFAALFANPICACGEVSGAPNNVYGCGFIDVEAAVETALGE